MIASIESPEAAALTLNGQELLSAMLRLCRQEGYSLACWKRPDHDFFEGIVDFDRPLLQEKINLDDMPPGFLLAPYDWNTPPYFIRSQIYFTSRGKLQADRIPSERLTAFVRQLTDIPADEQEAPEVQPVIHEDRQEDYIGLVSKAIGEIRKGTFQKVVPARSSSFDLAESSLPGLFLKLVSSYSHAFVNLTYTTDTGVWIGATPELLVSVHKNQIFETIALAGTQTYREDIPLSEVAWTQKEIEEQALVCRYIINCFKKIRLREYEEIGPKTIIAGNLIHLKTRFRVDMDAVGFPELGSVMLELLHPTSAVCGMPRDRAAEWLKQAEPFDREFFSGYLGPVNMGGMTTLYVNLRCMKYADGIARLYAGAGVTEDSNPEREWKETQIKMNTLLDCIRGDQTSI